jgi:hypothetical protein
MPEYLSVREVAQVYKVDELTVRRHIRTGKLRAVKVGGRVRVRKDDLERFEKPIAPAMEPTVALVRAAREDILRLAERHGAYNVRVFGSVARGDASADSDIDLLVDMLPGRSLFDLGGLWWDLNELLGVHVDVVTEQGLRPRIRQRVLHEAMPL